MTSEFRIGRKDFRSARDLVAAAADLLQELMTRVYGTPHAVLLPGGRTPKPVFDELALRRLSCADDLYVCFSDERMVPPESPESNYGLARPMIEHLAIPENRVIRVATDMKPDVAAKHYDRDLRQFLRCGGRITLALLGLGADGHTASLFSQDDLTRGRGAYAVATSLGASARVSVTPDLLNRAEVIIFLAVGPEKRDIVERMARRPETVTAAAAVRGAAQVHLWTA